MTPSTILLVEDDGFKERAIIEAIAEIPGNPKVQVERSVQTSVEAIRSDEYGLIILDIALPSHDRARGAGSPTSMPSGGLEVLLNLDRYHRRDPVVVLTQYPEVELWGEMIQLPNVEGHITKLLNVRLLGVVEFDRSEGTWRQVLRELIGEFGG